MGWLSLGSAEAAEPAVHPAVAGYKACRETSPADATRGALTPQDPCWSQLVALRRHQGRDPLGRDVYGEAGPQAIAPKAPDFAEQERSGAPWVPPPVFLVVNAAPQERVVEKAKEVERTKEEIEERRKKRAAPTESKFKPEPWQLVAAALTIGVTIGRFWGGK